MAPDLAEPIQADLVVVGAGGSGLAAAVAAAEGGASVIVLEKRQPGGSAALARGFFAAESPFQKRAMIHAPRDLTFKIAMNYAHLKIDPRIIRAFVDKSGDTAGWLEEKGLMIDMVTALYPRQVPLTWHVVEGGGARLIEILKTCCEEMGVTLLAHTEGKRILQDDKGQIRGVLAASADADLTIATKGVVLATGGYGGNNKLLKKYCPIYHEGMRNMGVPNMGDGIAMATSLDAATEGLGVLHLAGPYFFEKADMRIDNQKVLMPLAAVGFEPSTVWVNKKGERFIDECVGGDHFESANAVLRQPDRVAYMIVDSNMVQTMEAQGLDVGQGKYKELQRRGMPGLADALMSVTRGGKAKVSDSWEDIAGWMGANPQVLKKTIHDYNACCDQGYDPVFSKERIYLRPLRTAPYYVMRGDVCFLGTIGGIKINHHMEVINSQGNPIPGLYAAGVDAGGWTSDTYCGKLPGTTLGFALNSGRIAGEQAAGFVLERMAE